MSVLVAVYQAAAFYQGYETSEDFQRAWGFAFGVMLAFWVDEDCRGRAEIYRPSFDLGLFINLVWIFYLPFYLLKTRGKKGWLWIIGGFLLVYLGTILQWVVYAAS
jgi:hypothetical protein